MQNSNLNIFFLTDRFVFLEKKRKDENSLKCQKHKVYIYFIADFINFFNKVR